MHVHTCLALWQEMKKSKEKRELFYGALQGGRLLKIGDYIAIVNSTKAVVGLKEGPNFYAAEAYHFEGDPLIFLRLKVLKDSGKLRRRVEEMKRGLSILTARLSVEFS